MACHAWFSGPDPDRLSVYQCRQPALLSQLPWTAWRGEPVRVGQPVGLYRPSVAGRPPPSAEIPDTEIGWSTGRAAATAFWPRILPFAKRAGTGLIQGVRERPFGTPGGRDSTDLSRLEKECDLAMRMPAVHDRQGRRILILYRFSPELAESCLRPGYEPRQLKGYALGGIALVRRHGVRSPLIPARIISSENALHFVDAVQTVRQRAEASAMIMRHDTSSRLHAWIGGRGRWQCPHYHARFRVVESPESIDICGDSDDRQMHVAVKARLTRGMRRESMFRSTDQVLRLLQNELRSLGLIHRDRGGSADPRLAASVAN